MTHNILKLLCGLSSKYYFTHVLIALSLGTFCLVECAKTSASEPTSDTQEDPEKAIIDDIATVNSEGSEGINNNGNEEFVARYVNTKNPLLQLDGFEPCELNECYQICGLKNAKKAFCDTKNPKLCMCAVENFMSSNVEGVVTPVNREDTEVRNCSIACNIRNSYARIWQRSDASKSCICLLNHITSTGLTLCDEFAIKDLCKTICQSESAVCAFNGVCLCRDKWPSAFANTFPNIRHELETDKQECSSMCKEYHSEFVARIYDTKMVLPSSTNKSYEFRDKYCLCGEELKAENTSLMSILHNQGFQECTGLKCKMRCGMNMMAECEPKHRRACLCPRPTILIGKFLWARLPTRLESTCVDACKRFGLMPRVVEWNPFYSPELDFLNGVYRKSRFQYLYDGKFCHCVNLRSEPDMDQFRPCTDELCQWMCGHVGATCDVKTRRGCICNTHQMLGGLGRKPDPAERNCNVICRRNLHDARILEVKWDIPAPHWSVPKAKFCGCVRPVSAAGLTHCDGLEGLDICPKICRNPNAYCTRQKVCECFIQPDILADGMIRLPNGKEAEECGEICRSWTWPLAEDLDHEPYIYDESRDECAQANNCPPVDTTPWALNQPGALQVYVDALEEHPNNPKKYCLCVKSDNYYSKPGLRISAIIEPPRLPKTLSCISNYSCLAVTNRVHIVG